MRLFRIERKNLYRLWTWSSVAGVILFGALLYLDHALRARTGLGTADLQQFSTAGQYRAALAFWGRPDFTLRAGLILGIDYLFMPLYAVALFCSGLVVQDYFASRAPQILRRILAVATLVPPLGALLDAVENGLQVYLLNLARADDYWAELAFRISSAKWTCFYVGVALLLAALFSLRLRKTEKKLQSL
jgi:hypothetical protein